MVQEKAHSLPCDTCAHHPKQTQTFPMLVPEECSGAALSGIACAFIQHRPACPSQSLVLRESSDNSRLLDFSERWPGADLRAQQRRLWAPHQQYLAASGYQESTHAAAHPRDHLLSVSASALAGKQGT